MIFSVLHDFIKKKTRAGFAALLAVLLAGGTFLSSCGIIVPGGGEEETSGQPVDTDAPAGPDESFKDSIVRSYSIEEAEALVAELPDADMGGMAFFIASYDGGGLYLPGEDESSYISSARLKRNAVVEEKYSVTIMTKNESSAEAMTEQLAASQLSGLYYADLLSIHSEDLWPFVDGSYLLNMYSLPFTDYTAPYYNASAIGQLTAGYRLYAVAGAATENADNAYAVFFNRSIAEEMLQKDLYSAVRNGEWGLDAFFDLNYAVSQSSEAGIYGTVSDVSREELSFAALDFTDAHFADTTRGIQPTLYENTEHIEGALELARRLLSPEIGIRSFSSETETGMGIFSAGGALFYVGPLSDAYLLASAPVEWGLLPMPSTTESGIAPARMSGMTVLATPANNYLLKNTGLILQALGAASYRYMADAHSDYVKNVALRDNDSISMANIITRAHPVYDFSRCFTDIELLRYATADAFVAAVESGYSFESYYVARRDNASRQIGRAFSLDNAG